MVAHLILKKPNLTALALFALALFHSPGKCNAGGDWSSSWEETLRAAKKEGQIVLYT